MQQPTQIIAFLGGLFMILGLVPITQGQEKESWPKLELSADAWEFGKLDQGTQSTKIFVLKNSGKSDLIIKRVGVTCGCIKLKMDPTTIKPGEKLDLKVRLDLRAIVGKISKHIIIDCNDGRSTRHMIPVRGESLAIWWLSPTNLNFGRIPAGKPATKRFRLNIRPGLKLKVKELKSSHPLAKLKSTPFGKLNELHGYDLEVTLDAAIRPGAFRASIGVKVENEIRPYATVSLHADIMGAIRLSPRRISFGGVKRGREISREIDIVKLSGDELVISKTTCSDPRIKLELEELKKGRRYRLYVTFKAEGLRTSARGRITIHTNDKTQPILGLNYQGAIRP